MNIVLVGLELSPSIVATPAASALLLLSKALRLLDHEVTLILPYYRSLVSSGVLMARRLTPLVSATGSKAFLYESTSPSGAKLCFLEPEGRVLSDVESLRSPEGAEALAQFALAAGALCAERVKQGAAPDVVHAFGAEAGLVLALMKTEDGAIGRVLSLHEVGADVRVSEEFLRGAGLGAGGIEPFRGEGGFSLLQGALSAAEAVLTPSEVALERLSPWRESGRVRPRSSFEVIPEGVDTAVWNPATDSALTARFDPYDLSGKARCRALECQLRKLPLTEERPILLLDLDGASEARVLLALRSLPTLVRQGLSVLLTGPTSLSASLAELQQDLGEFIGSGLDPDVRTRRKLLSASDFYMSLSDGDLTGHVWLEAARMGAVPVAFEGGVARERIINADAELRSGNGLLLGPLDEGAFIEASGRMIAAYRRPNWARFVSRMMAQDFAWDRPARRFLQVYRRVLGAASVASRSASVGA